MRQAPTEGDPLDQAALDAVRCLAEEYPTDEGHAQHVAGLALRLFDELAPLHGLGRTDRFRLYCAALLHDIGWVGGGPGHHKRSMRLILAAPLPFSRRARRMIALVARYHRKALPRPDHPVFGSLSVPDQHRVALLAALLRVADGLDCTHGGLVDEVAVVVTPDRIQLRCRTRGPAAAEGEAALKKGDLLRQVCGRDLAVELVSG